MILTSDKKGFLLRSLIPVVLSTLIFIIFIASPRINTGDSKYTMLLSEQLFLHQSFALDEYFWPNVDSRNYPEVPPGKNLPRHIQRQAGHLYYVYPHGTSLLSVPLVAIMRLFGLSTINEDGRYNAKNEKIMQKVAASFLMAVAGLVFFLTARLLLNETWSVLIALAASLGTQIWSSASRSMQSHAWSVLLLACGLYLVLRAELKRGELRPLLLATIFAAAFFVRPTAIAYILPLAIFIFLRFRRQFPWLVGGAILWLTFFFIYSLHYFHYYLPFYFRLGAALKLETLGVGLPAQLISPSRGLFVYVPLTLCVAYLLIAYHRYLKHRSLIGASAVSIVSHILIVSSWWAWWAGGGGTYGARFTTDLVPFFVLLGVLGIRAFLDRDEQQQKECSVRIRPLRRTIETCIFGFILSIGIIFNGAGAISRYAVSWNNLPEEVDQNPKRIFDWRHPQFLCALFPYKISGAIKNKNGEGLPGVTVLFSEGGGSAVTNSKGKYSRRVGFGWSGQAQPVKRGLIFDPVIREYDKMSASHTMEGYMASPGKNTQ